MTYRRVNELLRRQWCNVVSGGIFTVHMPSDGRTVVYPLVYGGALKSVLTQPMKNRILYWL
jgi:hypothetical protein